MRIFRSFSKKAIAVIVAITVIISSAVVSVAVASVSTSNAWDGTIADSYAGGTGSSIDPYQIATAEQLARLVNDTETSGKYYKLTADIVLNESLTDNPKQWYNVTGDDAADIKFAGTLDGDGHTVSGLYFSAAGGTGYYGTAIIPRADNATIKNIGLVNSYMEITGNGTNCFLSSIVGRGNKVKVSGCFADETVVIKANKGIAGGIVAVMTGASNIENCYFTGSVSGEKASSPFFATGWTDYKNVKYCYTTSSVSKTANTYYTFVYTTATNGGFTDGTFGSVYVHPLYAIKGDLAKQNLTNFDFVNVWATVEDSTPVLRAFLEEENTDNGAEGAWSGNIAAAYESGSGTENDPYIIKTAEQLARLVNDTETSGKYYKLAADIVLNESLTDNPKQWYNVTGDDATDIKFAGTLDGDGHTVSGLYFSAAGNNSWFGSAIIPRADNATIKNIGLVNSYMEITGNGTMCLLGSIVGRGNKVKVIGCYADETVVINANKGRAGGIVAVMTGASVIENCYFTGSVSGTAACNPFYATGWTDYKNIKYCYTTLPVSKAGNTYYKYVYTTAVNGGFTDATYGNVYSVALADITGEHAKQNLTDFDFENVWETTDDSTPVLKAFIGQGTTTTRPDSVWTGAKADAYESGSGTKADPYLIKTAEQLAKLVNDTDTEGKYYKLIADIVLNDTSVKNWKESSDNISWYSVNADTAPQFVGFFDGDGHTVSGLYYDRVPSENGWRSGLFPMVGSGAVIRNVGVVDSYLSAPGCAAAIVGYTNNKVTGTNTKVEDPVNPIISGCYANETVTVSGYRVAGIVGGGSVPVDIDNCYFTGSLSAAKMEEDGTTPVAAGMATYFWTPGGNIVNSYCIGYPLYRTTGAANFTIRDCYSNVEQANVKLRTVKQMTGEKAKTNMPAFEWGSIWQTSAKTPVLLKVPTDYKASGYDGKKGELWTGQIATNYAGGNGTKNDPYLIETAEQLAKFVSGVIKSEDNPTGVYYKLTADIYLNDTSKADWKKEARSWYFSTWSQYEKSKGFRGSFDGNGHVVSGLYLNVDNQGQVLGGLIPVIGEGGVVKNVGVVNSYLRGYDWKHGNGWIGAVVGYCYAWEMPKDNNGAGHMATISGCFADGTVTVSGQMAGGILGATPRAILIENCYFTGTLLSETDGKKGGIVGYNWSGVIQSPIKNCYVATAAKDSAIGKCFDTTKCENVYCTVATVSGGRILSLKSMRGDNAVKYMDGFDFGKVWYACDDGTPVLRAFGKNSKYSNKSPFEKVYITFITNCDIELEAICGEEGETIKWPTITREGYEFEGWYVYKELDVKFPLDVYPMNNVTLYAKWKSLSVKQSFETDYDADKLLGSDYEVYKLGTPGFNLNYVHDGLVSIHRLGKTDENSAFVLFGENLGQLVPGNEYSISVWVYVESGKSPVVLNLYQLASDDLSAKLQNAISLAELDESKFGQWQEIKVNFVASDKYLAIESSGGSSIFFDDITVMPTGKTGEISSANNDSGNLSVIIWVVIAASAIILVAVIIVVCVFAKKRRNK